MSEAAPFARRLLAWFDRHGRHNLPWQHPRSAYRVWLAEIMLQQTQVAAVIPYFQRFVARFPDLRALAAAPADDVLALWSGLGYYARARNLHRAAQVVVAQYGGRFPQRLDAVLQLPGIGRSTAGAILAQAYGQRHAILDGNVRRVLARHAAVSGWPGETMVNARLWHEAEHRLPSRRLADYTQAIMDLGATLCTARQPRCSQCPVAGDCAALQQRNVIAYPAARPRRVRPQRKAWLLLADDGAGRLLMLRRPPAGLWGGLWCLPVAEHEDWRQSLPPLALAAQGEPRPLPPFTHAFTHFHLQLHPLRVEVNGTAVRDADSAWLTIDDALARGVPAPVRKLLMSLRKEPT
jgi:A/G-specific adenine glycosylase